jgi:hypothetical protein
MGKKKVAKRSKVKPFIKVVNYSHLLPTRYMLELESLKGSVTNETFKEPTQREDAKKAVKKAFEERYAKGTNRWCESNFPSRMSSAFACWKWLGGSHGVSPSLSEYPMNKLTIVLLPDLPLTPTVFSKLRF